jgi:hypothetical protein
MGTFHIQYQDANGDNVTVLTGQLGQENKENWLLVGSVILKAFNDLQLLISDKEKGLDSMKGL